MSATNNIDRFFLYSTVTLTIAGFVIFLSASLGLLSQAGNSFSTIAIKQSISLAIGIILFIAISKIKYTFFRKIATPILLLAIAFNLLLFIPSLTLHFNGASRWLNFGIFSIQPSEFLKLASIIYFAAWLNFAKDRIRWLKFGLLPYIAIMSILGTLLLIQSDTDTLVIISIAGLIMFVIVGMPIRHLIYSCILLGVVVAGVIYFRPYAGERFKVYLNPTANTQGSAYQINQSLIAIGSGGMFGRGFGQSIQKFGYLPQPTDDSIFAVAVEEFGFIGGLILIVLYCLFTLSILRIATRVKDIFGAMLATGLAILVIAESFLNIAAMLGLVPISGLPLLFVSHGGTALIIILAGAGIVANISKYSVKT